MSTLDDLRTTLDRHASGLPDPGLPGRTGAVRERVRVVRRRRRAGTAGALAVVLAVVGVGLAGLSGVERPADRELAGATAPATLTSLGYTYAFDRGVEGDGSATVRLPASDRPRLVAWATSGRDRVTVDGPYDDQDSVARDFGDFRLVPPGGAARVTVAGTGVGRVGLAVYEPTGQAPVGVTVDGITYRERVGEQRLAGAAIGRLGETRVSARVPVVDGVVRVKALCAGMAGPAWIHVAVAGRPTGTVGGSGSCREEAFDPGAEGTYSLTRLGGAGGGDAGTVEVTVTATVGRSVSSAPVTGASLRLGFGLYRPGEVVRVGGQPQDRVVEEGGHTYRLLTSQVLRTRSTEVGGLPARTPVLVAVTYASDGIRSVTLRHGGRRMDLGGSSRGGTVSQVSRGLGSSAVVDFRADDAADHLGLTVYERAD